MKLKKMGFTLGLASLALGGVAFVTSTGTTGAVRADAVDEITTDYRVAGSFIDPATGTNLNWGFPGTPFDTVTEKEGETWYEVTIDFALGDQFKIVRAGENAWDWVSPSWPAKNWTVTNNTAGENGSAGCYTISIPANYAGGDEPVVTRIGDTETVTVTYMLPDGKSETAEVSSTIRFNPSSIIVEGYQFLGWYTDEDLTIPWDVTKKATDGLILYGKYETSPDDYYIYLETWTDNPFKYAYYFNSIDGKAPVNWPGTEMEPVSMGYNTAEGISIYRVKIDTDYSADKIIFTNNHEKTEQEQYVQTADLPLGDSPAVYEHSHGGHEGVVEDSDSKVEALVFLDYWATTVRVDHEWGDPASTWTDSICWLIDDDKGWADLKAHYEALSEGAKTIVDATYDANYGEVSYTVGQTYEYLVAAHASDEVAAGAPTILGENGNDLTIAIASIVGAMLLGVGAYFFLRKKKEAPRA